MAHALTDRHYASLLATERFALLVEAMARGDEREADRLEDTCPRLTYRCEDQAFRDRMRQASAIAHRVSLNMREGLAQIRMARLLHEHAELFAGDSIRVMQAVFLYGREYGRWEAGAVEEIGVPEAAVLAGEVAARPDLGRQMEELRDVGVQTMRATASVVRKGVGEAHAVDLLSQWEGFGRFSRETLGLEPITLMRAFGLEQRDPAMEVRGVYPMARADEATAAEWTRRWARSWQRRVG